MISFAQTGEDVLLARVFPPEYKGFYIDAGANHPVNNNVTKHFYLHGWHGINIEPVRFLAAALQADRPRDVNLNVGLANQSGTLQFFRTLPNLHAESHELSSFDPAVAATLQQSGHALTTDEIPVMTLREICAKYVTGPIDFLKIDVEGHERLALEGADLVRYPPRIILVEDGSYHPRADWEPLILRAGYQEACWDGVNRYYAKSNDQAAIDRLRAPISVLDNYTPYRFWLAVETAQHQAADETRRRQTIEQELTGQIAALGATVATLQAANAALELDRAQGLPARQIVTDIGPTAARRLQRLALWLRRHPRLLRLGKILASGGVSPP